uniref:Yip1 family protein n=1 Tax=uncultured Draconibacterium sp. TaxID=1573823 RepID=UPI003217F52F
MNLKENNHSEETTVLSDKEVFTNIWTSPRKVFKYINNNEYDKFVYVLLFLAGITQAFDRAVTKSMGDNLSLIVVIIICVLLGGFLGWISLYFYSALISWTGKWLNGQGDTTSLLRMTAHAMLPSIVALVLLIPQIIYFGNAIFQSEIDISSSGTIPKFIYYSTAFLETILGAWTLILFVIGISEIQKLSIGKSILNMILPGLIIIVPIATIAYILGDFFG